MKLINKVLVGLLGFLLILYIINDLDDMYELEGCHQGGSSWELGSCGRPIPPPPSSAGCSNFKCPVGYKNNKKNKCLNNKCSVSQCCISENPKCKYLVGEKKYKCFASDKTCSLEGKSNILGSVTMSSKDKSFLKEITSICDHTPDCGFIEYDGHKGTFYKTGSCEVKKLSPHKDIEIWKGPGGKGPAAGPSKSAWNLFGDKSSSNKSGSKGTITKGGSGNEYPYAFNINEKLCQSYCDSEKDCGAAEWNKVGNISTCFLRKSPIDPKEFVKADSKKGSKPAAKPDAKPPLKPVLGEKAAPVAKPNKLGKEEFAIYGGNDGYIRLHQNRLKDFLSCN